MSRKAPEVDIIIPAHGNSGLTMQCLTHLIRTISDVKYRVTVIDDASPDATTRRMLHWWWINTRPWVPWAKHRGVSFRVIRNDTNLGFSRSNNRGAAGSKADWLLFMNNDAFPDGTGWLEALIATADHDGFDAIGPRGDNVLGIQCSKWDFHFPPIHWAKFLSGYCLLVRREAFLAVGGWDETFLMGDEDLALSIELRRKGYRLGVARHLFVRHLNQATMKDWCAKAGTTPAAWYGRTRQQLLGKYGQDVNKDLFMWEECGQPSAAWRELGVLPDGTYFARPGKPEDAERSIRELRGATVREFCPGPGDPEEGQAGALGELCSRYPRFGFDDTFAVYCGAG